MKRATGKSNISIVQDYLAGNRPFIQLGWTPDLVERKDGETWKDNTGAVWKMENGQKKQISYISPIVDSYIPKCKCGQEIRWGTKLDEKMFRKTGRCFDCQLSYETKLRKDGLYEKYEKYKIFNNQKSYCLDIKAKLEETINYLKNKDNTLKYLNEDGSWDVWPDTMRENLLNSAEKDLKECVESINRIENQLLELNFNEQ